MKAKNVNYADSPVVWFSVMEAEASRGNYARAAEAKRRLERLGVVIKLRGKTAKKFTEAERGLSQRKPTVLDGGTYAC